MDINHYIDKHGLSVAYDGRSNIAYGFKNFEEARALGLSCHTDTGLYVNYGEKIGDRDRVHFLKYVDEPIIIDAAAIGYDSEIRSKNELLKIVSVLTTTAGVTGDAVLESKVKKIEALLPVVDKLSDGQFIAYRFNNTDLDYKVACRANMSYRKEKELMFVGVPIL